MLHALIVALLAVPAPVQDKDDTDKAVQEAVEKFKDVYFSPRSGEKDRLGAVQDVAKLKHPKTLFCCAVGLKDFADTVRIEAARQIGTFEETKGAGGCLLRALDDRSNQKRRAVRREIVGSLGRLKELAALPVLHRLMPERDFELAKAAVLACGEIRHKSSIPIMIGVLKKAEREPENMSDPGNPGEGIEGYDLGSVKGQVNSDQKKEQERRKRILHRPLLLTLKKLTGQRYDSAKSWEIWWRKYGATFQIKKLGG